jgi:hypothetical protein
MRVIVRLLHAAEKPAVYAVARSTAHARSIINLFVVIPAV